MQGAVVNSLNKTASNGGSIQGMAASVLGSTLAPNATGAAWSRPGAGAAPAPHTNTSRETTTSENATAEGAAALPAVAASEPAGGPAPAAKAPSAAAGAAAQAVLAALLGAAALLAM